MIELDAPLRMHTLTRHPVSVASPSRRLAAGCQAVRFEGSAEVHLWSSSTCDPGAAGDSLAILDDAERRRAEQLRFEHDRLRFVHAHAFARRVLAGYLRIPPATIRFRTTPHGKPGLAGRPDVSFSLSHAGDVVVVAVGQGQAVGVDVERLRRVDDALALASGLFTAREAGTLRRVPPADRSAAFLALWTRKELVVKACGAGLSMPLDTFDVLDDDGGWTGPRRVQLADATFTVGAFRAPTGYIGAVTVARASATTGHQP